MQDAIDHIKDAINNGEIEAEIFEAYELLQMNGYSHEEAGEACEEAKKQGIFS